MISARGVHKAFGSNKVLQGLDVDIQKGETFTIMGGSGTGKSVFLKHLVGLLKPDTGKIQVDGVEITNLGEEALFEVQKKFAYVFQGAALFDSLTVGGNVSFGLRNLSGITDEREIARIVRERLAMVGLSNVEHLKPAELSGGMKKRVGIARAIAMSPEYLLYDEPTTGLDPIMSDVINDLILHLQKTLGVTSIVVTHDMKSAYKVSSRIGMLYQGRLIGMGTPREIQETADPVIRQFITGSSQGPIQMKLRADES